MGSTKNLFGVLIFVFVVGAISVGVGFSLYHCLAKQHIGGLGGEVEKTSGICLSYLSIINVEFNFCISTFSFLDFVFVYSSR